MNSQLYFGVFVSIQTTVHTRTQITEPKPYECERVEIIYENRDLFAVYISLINNTTCLTALIHI